MDEVTISTALDLDMAYYHIFKLDAHTDDNAQNICLII
jgi:hypothetical protein